MTNQVKKLRAASISAIRFILQALTPTDSPPAGSVFAYFKTDGLLYVKNSSGVEMLLGGGGGGWIETLGTPVTVTNIDTEQTVYSKVVDGGTLGSHKALRVKIQARIIHLVVQDMVIRLKYGSTTMLTITIPAGTGTADKSADIEFLITASGATNLQRASGRVDMQDVIPNILSRWNQEGTATEDSTSDQTLSVTVQWAIASANLTYAQSWVGLELLG